MHTCRKIPTPPKTCYSFITLIIPWDNYTNIQKKVSITQMSGLNKAGTNQLKVNDLKVLLRSQPA